MTHDAQGHMMFELSWQDFRSHQFGDPRPPVQRQVFAGKDAADRRKAELQSIGLIACVTPVVVRHRRKARPVLIDGEGPRFNAEWKLAK